MSTETINFLLSFGAIATSLVSIFLLIVILKPRKEHVARVMLEKHSLTIGFLAALGAAVGSLVYSNYIGYAPCDFCWYQRIVMYPQVLILLIAAWKKDYSVWIYTRALSIIGLLIALYQYYGQMFNTSALPCPANGVSCAQVPFLEFGFVTIPLMAAMIFAFLIIISFFKPHNK